MSRPIHRRSLLIGGFAVAVAIVTAGCSEIAARLGPDAKASVYRSQLTPVKATDRERIETAAEILQARLRFLADPSSQVLPVSDDAGRTFLLAEVPSETEVVLDTLVLTQGQTWLIAVPAETKVGASGFENALGVPMGGREDQSVRLAPGPDGAERLEVMVNGTDAQVLAKVTADPNRALGVLMDGTIRLVATIEAPILDGRISLVSPADPATLRTLGAIMRSGGMPVDLVADPNGDIRFED